MEEELRSHIQHRADDLARGGLDRAEAERRARIEFGGYVRFKDESHEAMGGIFFEILVQDVRFALRVLRKSPGFTLAAVLTLALAIGANAVVFSVMNGLILRPLNVPQAQSLYGIERASDKDSSQSYPNYVDLRDRNRSFDGLAAFDVAPAGLDTGQNPSLVWGMEASGNYFDVLRIQPYLGRLIHPSDEHGPNSAPYIVLSYAYWHSHFQDDRGVVGRIVQLNKHPFTIIGVAPPGFRGTVVFFSPDFFVPMVNRQQVEGANDLNARGSRWLFMVMGHLKAGVTPAQATADLNSIGSYLEKTYPKDERQISFSLVRPGLLGDNFGRPVREFVTSFITLYNGPHARNRNHPLPCPELTPAPLFAPTAKAAKHVPRILHRRGQQGGIFKKRNAACATGITAYLLNGGTLENAQAIAAHESPRTTKLYDRTSDEITLDEIERIGI